MKPVIKIIAWLIGTYIVMPLVMLYCIYLALVFYVVGYNAAAIAALVIAALCPVVIYKSGEFLK